jgi:hypothetical protein
VVVVGLTVVVVAPVVVVGFTVVVVAPDVVVVAPVVVVGFTVVVVAPLVVVVPPVVVVVTPLVVVAPEVVVDLYLVVVVPPVPPEVVADASWATLIPASTITATIISQAGVRLRTFFMCLAIDPYLPLFATTFRWRHITGQTTQPRPLASSLGRRNGAGHEWLIWPWWLLTGGLAAGGALRAQRPLGWTVGDWGKAPLPGDWDLLRR